MSLLVENWDTYLTGNPPPTPWKINMGNAIVNSDLFHSPPNSLLCSNPGAIFDLVYAATEALTWKNYEVRALLYVPPNWHGLYILGSNWFNSYGIRLETQPTSGLILQKNDFLIGVTPVPTILEGWNWLSVAARVTDSITEVLAKTWAFGSLEPQWQLSWLDINADRHIEGKFGIAAFDRTFYVDDLLVFPLSMQQFLLTILDTPSIPVTLDNKDIGITPLSIVVTQGKHIVKIPTKWW